MDRGYIRCGIDACPGHVCIPSDAYGVIRSTEIREYLRMGDIMDIFEKERVILHSYTSVWQKAAEKSRKQWKKCAASIQKPQG